MRTLFTPWRYAYITRTSPEPGCFFCAAAHTPDEDAERLVVARGRHHLLMLNRHPYSNGHLMVAPFAHLSTPRDAGEEVQRELWPLVLKAQSALERAYRPHGFNLLRASQSLRRPIRSTRCNSPLVRTSVARPRVGWMFCSRLGSLIRAQMSRAVARAWASESAAYLRK